MPESNFDPNYAFDAYRSALAPTLRAQQEGLKALERLGRYQYAVAGDYLEWSLAQAKANLSVSTPAELAATQTSLATQFNEKFKGRVQELVNLASEAQNSFNQLLGEATAKVAETIKKAS
jgi:hypothetical protein